MKRSRGERIPENVQEWLKIVGNFDSFLSSACALLPFPNHHPLAPHSRINTQQYCCCASNSKKLTYAEWSRKKKKRRKSGGGGGDDTRKKLTQETKKSFLVWLCALDRTEPVSKREAEAEDKLKIYFPRNLQEPRRQQTWCHSHFSSVFTDMFVHI